MPVDDLAPVLDLKPLSYNPFTDGTVVYDNTSGVLVPRSASGLVSPLGSNPLLDARPSTASTQSLIDSAQAVTPSGLKANAAALRGYQTTGDFFDTNAFGRAVDTLSDAELNDLIDGVTAQGSRAAAEAAAVAPRQAAQQALRRGSQFAGALGTAIDAYNLADAVLDPTNNPADEIGDIAGSMLGGALGSGLGPVGALGGSLIGGWLGRQVGNLLQGDGRKIAHDPNQGTTGTTYIDYVRTTNRQWDVTSQKTGYPIRFETRPRYSLSGSIYLWVLWDNPDGTTGEKLIYNCNRTFCKWANPRYVPQGAADSTDPGYDPDADPRYPPRTVIEYPPLSGPRVSPRSPLEPPTRPGPMGDPLRPGPTGDPLPNPTGEPRLNLEGPAFPDPTGGAGLESPPAPDDVSPPRPRTPNTGPATNPNPEPGCCDLTALRLEQLLRDVELIKTQFHTSGFATLDMSVCGESASELLPWTGSGLVGIYDALETLSAATNRLWAQVKCPPDATAAVPMAWDIKVHEHPQLIVLWAPVEGGSSRWAMHIPHPKPTINSDYVFNFPIYTKGAVRGTLILSDNSRVIVNGESEMDCTKVLNYVRQLIIPSYLDGAQELFTKGTARFRTCDVKAVYVKSFAGHRNQAPLWVKGLNSR